MRVARIANFGPSCDASEGRYQVVEMSDKKYALVIGDIRLIRRLPLPIHVGSGVTIHEFDCWRNCNGPGMAARLGLNQTGITSRPANCARHGSRGRNPPPHDLRRTTETSLILWHRRMVGEQPGFLVMQR
jgi:hypothetical protein